MADLTDKQRAFVDHYLDCLNATEAARRAGYSKRTARAIGAENLTKPDIATAIRDGLEAKAMPSEEVLARLAEHARGSMGEFLRVDEEDVTLTWSLITPPQTEDGEPDAVDLVMRIAQQANVAPTDRILHTVTVKRAVARLDLMQAKDKLHLVKKYTLDDKGKVSIELYDAQAALALLAKHHGLLVDRQEVSGPGGAPLLPPIREVVVHRPAQDADANTVDS